MTSMEVDIFVVGSFSETNKFLGSMDIHACFVSCALFASFGSMDMGEEWENVNILAVGSFYSGLGCPGGIPNQNRG